MHIHGQWLGQFFHHFIEAILPAQCLLCHLPSNNKLICSHCRLALTQDRPCCQHCGLPLLKSQPFCGDCLQQTHLFTQLHALADYQRPYPLLIKKFKYGKQLINGELLAELLFDSITQQIDPSQLAAIDYLLAVPLHSQKLRQRGFNQAQLLADNLADRLQLPLLISVVMRDKATTAQEKLSLPKRKHNLSNAFSVSKQQSAQLSGRYIVIIDDVVTTGATVNSLAKTLLQAGAKRVDVWCVCRTPLAREK